MTTFTYPFVFSESNSSQVKGCLELEQPLPFSNSRGSGFYRPGKIALEGCPDLDLGALSQQGYLDFYVYS